MSVLSIYTNYLKFNSCNYISFTIVCWSTSVVDAAAYLFARAFFRDVAEQQSAGGAIVDYQRAFGEGERVVEGVTRRVLVDGQSEPVERPYYALADPSVRVTLEDGRWAAGVPRLLLDV